MLLRRLFALLVVKLIKNYHVPVNGCSQQGLNTPHSQSDSCLDVESYFLFIFTLDVDAFDGINIRVAEAVDHRMLKLDHIYWKATLQNTTTDTGGGGIYAGLHHQLEKTSTELIFFLS